MVCQARVAEFQPSEARTSPIIAHRAYTTASRGRRITSRDHYAVCVVNRSTWTDTLELWQLSKCLYPLQ